MSHPLLRYFAHSHLPAGPLRDTSAKLGALAAELDALLPDGTEKTVALRKLLESKDAAVRAALDIRLTEACSRPEMTVTGPFRYCDDPKCPLHGA